MRLACEALGGELPILGEDKGPMDKEGAYGIQKGLGPFGGRNSGLLLQCNGVASFEIGRDVRGSTAQVRRVRHGGKFVWGPVKGFGY